jgi:hypothetical protein
LVSVPADNTLFNVGDSYPRDVRGVNYSCRSCCLN